MGCIAVFFRSRTAQQAFRKLSAKPYISYFQYFTYVKKNINKVLQIKYGLKPSVIFFVFKSRQATAGTFSLFAHAKLSLSYLRTGFQGRRGRKTRRSCSLHSHRTSASSFRFRLSFPEIRKLSPFLPGGFLLKCPGCRRQRIYNEITNFYLSRFREFLRNQKF